MISTFLCAIVFFWASVSFAQGTPTNTPTSTPTQTPTNTRTQTPTLTSSPTVTLTPTITPPGGVNACYGNGVWLNSCDVAQSRMLIGNDNATASFYGPPYVMKPMKMVPDNFAGNCESIVAEVVPLLYYEDDIICDDTGLNIMTGTLYLDNSYLVGDMFWTMFYRNNNATPTGGMGFSFYCSCNAIGETMLEYGIGTPVVVNETYLGGSKDVESIVVGPFNQSNCTGTCVKDSFLSVLIFFGGIDQFADVQFMAETKLEILQNPKGTEVQ